MVVRGRAGARGLIGEGGVCGWSGWSMWLVRVECVVGRVECDW